MNNEKILNEVIKYLDDEYNEFVGFTSRQSQYPSIPSKYDELVLIERYRKSTLDRGMGVIMFVQKLNIAYTDVIQPYIDFKYNINRVAKQCKETLSENI